MPSLTADRMRGLLALGAVLLFLARAAIASADQVTLDADKASVFYGGLCVAGRPQSCQANANAQNTFSNLPGLVVAGTVNGSLPGGANALVQSICSKQKISLIAFSAGYLGLDQTVKAMSSDCRKKVVNIVSLESNYSGFTDAVNLVRVANPNVNVQYYTASQFGTYHDAMPASSKIADAIAQLTGAEAGVAGPPSTAPGVVQAALTPYQQTLQPAAQLLSPYGQSNGFTNPLFSQAGLPQLSQSSASAVQSSVPTLPPPSYTPVSSYPSVQVAGYPLPQNVSAFLVLSSPSLGSVPALGQISAPAPSSPVTITNTNSAAIAQKQPPQPRPSGTVGTPSVTSIGSSPDGQTTFISGDVSGYPSSGGTIVPTSVGGANQILEFMQRTLQMLLTFLGPHQL